MGFTASVITSVLKAVVGDKLGGGLTKDLIEISIDGITEKGINEITDFINREKLKIDSILSKENTESMGISEDYFDYVVTEIKELLRKIDIADEVLRQCKYDSMNLSVFLWNKYKECKNDYIECESEIKLCLFAVAEALNKLVYESENFEKNVLIHISNSVDDTNVELQKISEYMDSNFGKLNADNRVILEILQIILKQNQEESTKNKDKKQKIKSRTQEYADKWEANMFLNDFDKRDENAGVNIKLSKVYLKEQLPHYKWGGNQKISDDLEKLLSEYISTKDGNKMLLILGQPGIGKSTLITWIVANFVEKKDDILVYQIANDLGSIDWQCENILNDIFEVIGLRYEELEDKTLILDGFDEIYVDRDRERILNKLYQELKSRIVLKNFSLIITCRENYIYNLQTIKCNYITLQVWNEVQIGVFCRIYWEKCGSEIAEDKIQKILENKEIYGIPLILYMILALNITIEKSSSIVDIYDQIFSLKKGGIYDRCYTSEHRINEPEIKKYIHQTSQKIAFWIFEHNNDKAFITQENFEEICYKEMDEFGKEVENKQIDVLIGNFFNLKYYEGKNTNKIYFIHRSIYEYFVVIYFFESLCCLKSKEEIAGKLGELLKDGRLTERILEIIKYKFNSVKKCSLPDITKEIFNIMLQDGMTYHTKEIYKCIIEKEMNIFSNMLEVIHLWNNRLEKFNNRMVSYLRYNQLMKLNLTGVDLKEINLVRANLADVNLTNSNLMNANLRSIFLARANLEEANLKGANLEKANLTRANLSNASLTNAYLMQAKLEEAVLENTNLKGANLEGANLKGANLIRAILENANLEGTELAGASLKNADLRSADLKGANLSGVDLRGANLSGAILANVESLYNVRLEGANLVEVDLSEANLVGADISNMNLSDIKLEDAIMDEEQIDLLHEKYNLHKIRVYIIETDEIISYQTYCVRKFGK